MCPDLEQSLGFAWPVFLLPILWIAIGAMCGLLAAVVSRASRDIWGTMMAGCGFANATGLPITLLTALAGSDEHKLQNYLLLVSIYQILFPTINWTVGRKMLSKAKEEEISEELESNLNLHIATEKSSATALELPDKTKPPKTELAGIWERVGVGGSGASSHRHTLCFHNVHPPYPWPPFLEGSFRGHRSIQERPCSGVVV